MNKMNVEKVSDEELQDLFADAFEKVSKYNNIEEFECKCIRTVAGGELVMEVMISGLAGTPSYESIHTEIFEDLEKISISREGSESKLDFERLPESDYVLNTNDYVIAYKSI